MDAISILIGGMLGGLAGWAFSHATTKRREAYKLRNEASKAKQKEVLMKGEAKNNWERSFADMVQGFLFYALGISIIGVMGVILVTALG